jgi:hypothetical protein
MRPHMALNGLTPAEIAGIDLGLEQNKWEALIRRSFINSRLGGNQVVISRGKKTT